MCKSLHLQRPPQGNNSLVLEEVTQNGPPQSVLSLWEACTTVTFLAQMGHLLLLDGKLQRQSFPLDCSGWVRWDADSKRITNGDDEKTGWTELTPDFVRRVVCGRTNSEHRYVAKSAREPQRPLRELPYGPGLEAHSRRS